MMMETEQVTGESKMVDYSETLLSINTAMKEVHKLLLANKVQEAEGYLKAISESADMLANWLHNSK